MSQPDPRDKPVDGYVPESASDIHPDLHARWSGPYGRVSAVPSRPGEEVATNYYRLRVFCPVTWEGDEPGTSVGCPVERVYEVSLDQLKTYLRTGEPEMSWAQNPGEEGGVDPMLLGQPCEWHRNEEEAPEGDKA